MDAGMKPGTPVTDERVYIDGWRPRNSNREFAGEIDVRTAFAFSINTVAAKIGQQVGFDTIADMAQRFGIGRSEEHTSELQSLMRISYAVFCLKKKTTS